MIWATLAMLMLGQEVASKDPVTFLTADQVREAIQKAPEDRSGRGGLYAARLAAAPEYSVVEIRRTSAGRSELHARFTDVWYVLRGNARLITGGSLIDAQEIEPGELRGRGISRGDMRRIRGGDVVVVPPGVPHWIGAVEGKEIVYLIVKVSSSR
jgi:mannose-6-phosphate isomerase-like protein (cupin superfamily)